MPPRLALTALSLLALTTACAQPTTLPLPLPPGWQEGAPPRHDAPFDWGVPPFDAPSAEHCRRPALLREQGGAQAPALQERGARKAGPEALGAPASSDVGTSRAERRDHAAAQAPALQRPHAPPVTAGMVDDNADFGAYLAFLGRNDGLELRRRDVAERYRIEVRDARDRPVPDAELALAWAGARESVLWARSDAGGSAWLHPRAVLPPQADGHALEVQVRSGGQITRARLQRGQKATLTLRLPRTETPARTRLDLVFLIDATGSMGDEIAKLKSSLRTIADQIARLPSQPDLCFGLVAYRDKGDAFLIRTLDFSDRLGEFQQQLARVHAGGGGDNPEALNEALHETVHKLSWRGAGTTRLVVLLADAPPHLDYGAPYYDQDSAAALAKGIKLHTVGASGLDAQGEAVLRQIAQGTGGRFVFLTYRDAHDPSGGPGDETVHDVRNYSVDTLDRLIVRLVREELARRPGS